MHRAAVAGEQEARQASRSAPPDRARSRRRRHGRPCPCYHATAITRTVPAKSGMSNMHLGGAVGLDRDDAGIERERLLRRRRCPAARPPRCRRRCGSGRACPACRRSAGRRDRGFRREPALAEIVVVGRRRLVVGQVEDADIDGGDDDARLLAGAQARRPSPECAARCSAASSCGSSRSTASVRALRLTENHCTPMARPGMRSACVSSGRRKRRHHIGAAAPVAADRNAQLRGAGRHVLRDGRASAGRRPR